MRKWFMFFAMTATAMAGPHWGGYRAPYYRPGPVRVIVPPMFPPPIYTYGPAYVAPVIVGADVAAGAIIGYELGKQKSAQPACKNVDISGDHRIVCRDAQGNWQLMVPAATVTPTPAK